MFHSTTVGFFLSKCCPMSALKVWPPKKCFLGTNSHNLKSFKKNPLFEGAIMKQFNQKSVGVNMVPLLLELLELSQNFEPL